MSNTIGLNEDKVKGIVDWLNGYLADLHVLYVKLHNLHWNVEGVAFFELHKKLEEYYDEVAGELDEIAERVLQLGQRPEASLSAYLKRAEVKELPSVRIGAKETVQTLKSDFASLIGKQRKGIALAQAASDEGTADMLIGILKAYEKRLWMVNAYLA